MLSAEIVRACEQAMKEGSSSFYHAFKFLPSPKKEAVFVIYAFCRMIDDAVDEPEKSIYTLEELEYCLENLDRVEDHHFIWPALKWLFAHFPLTKNPFYTQISGQRMDYVKTAYQSMDELEEYCYRVAGSVGEMLLPILHDQPNHLAMKSGIALGKAMQIVNIIRDVGADQKLGRRYIPLDIMTKHGYTQAEFEEKVINWPFKLLINEMIYIADEWFKEGLKYIHTYPRESAVSIRLAAGYYREITQVIQENEYEVFTKRAVVTNTRKGKLFLQLTN
ncbi:phytoene/squalene synthase family protein [Aquibacillus koreensis]|uniref:Phytoene/squalene synthase family protein n=1 Tax=Aquibacillus koreensis TaxID=279446 RepID=A0A9X4AL45_9BACI|nr:phytoene/squalene synthase family protein [Aquibacillus koreensis]MCT2536138.1 phytoene/squalene synthase family protein [Aquibacillus koreensis]MDC3422063.1 phytoene/squalene synthase family protein [Aquibacillus koreensis]